MFWRGVVGYLPANVAQGLVGFGAIVLFTRVLTPEEYGAYALAVAVMSLAHTSLFTWMEAAMARFWAARQADGRIADHMATLQRLWVATALVFPIVAGLILWLVPMPPQAKIASAAGLATIWFRSAAKMAQERFRAGGQVGPAARMDLVQSIGGFAVGLGVALVFGSGAAPLVGLGAAAIACLIPVLPGELKLARGGRFDPDLARGYATYGLPVAASLILAVTLATTDRFVLGAVLGEGAVGAYHAGYGLASRTLDVLFIWLGTAGGPALIMALERGGKPALEAAAREQAGVMLLIAAPAAVGLALVAGPLCELMVGEALRGDAARVTPWIAASALISGLTTYYFSQAFTLGRRTGLLLLALAIPAVANLALNLVLIPRYGLDGALWATVAGYSIGGLCAMLLGRLACALPIPWRAAACVTSACAVMAAAVSLVPDFGGVIELAAKAAVGGVVYAVAVLAIDGELRSRVSGLMSGLRTRVAA
jgi:O-antigen/teichoic acid export membrane protein